MEGTGRVKLRRRYFAGSYAAAALLSLAGCHSSYIDADVRNSTGAALQTVEVDYPGGSFGRSNIAAGADFHYRFKILGSGATKVLWTDARGQDHSVTGPDMHEGQAGHVTITVGTAAAGWQSEVTQ